MENNPGRVTRHSPPKVPTNSSSVTVDEQGVTNPQHAVLRMAYDEVFDVPPPVGVGDVVLPTSEIQRLGRDIFSTLM